MKELNNINLTPTTLEDAIATTSRLVKIIVELKNENDLLREKLNINSSNSSLSPSRDLKKKKKNLRPKIGWER